LGKDRHMWSIMRMGLVASVAFLSTSWVLAEDTPKSAGATSAKSGESNDKETKRTTARKTEHPFLGVYVTPVHPSLFNHLGDVLSREQGLIVEEVFDDSAAAKAGIRVHDILTTYDDQKLFSDEQLAKLINADQVGREVTLGLLREGKRQRVEVKLGDASQIMRDQYTPGPAQASGRLGSHGGLTSHTHSGAGSTGAGSHDAEWETFDSMTLKRLKDNKFRAEVEYLDKEGKTEKHVFEGTREELRKAIENEKDMKPTERTHLLRTLGLHGSNDQASVPHVWFAPPAEWFIDPI